jgi:hypothetical protein
MALNCIIVGSETGGPSRIFQFLENVQFFAVIAQCDTVAEAIEQHQAIPAHYFIVHSNLANETLLSLQQLPESQRPRLIILGPEETYFLENADADLAIFGEELKWPTLLQAQTDPTFKFIPAEGELNVPSTLKDQFEIAIRSQSPVWMLLRPGEWQLGGKEKSRNSLFVRTEGNIKRLRKDDLLLIEAQKDYLVLTTAKEKFRVLRSMKSIEMRLDSETHCRVHRSFIINLAHLHTIDAEELWLDGLETPIPIGPSYRKELLKKLDIL